jgi:serine/threonine-protein kinase RsbW
MRSEHAPVTVRVPFSASSVATARRRLKEWMRDNGYPREAIEDGRVILSELVANSIRHAEPLADGTILITWCHDGDVLRLSITDGGSPSKPHTLRASSSALSGRGMAIVETLAADWWTERSRSQATVHAILPLG